MSDYLKAGTILEIEEGGIMTRCEVVTDYGDKVHCQILEHYFADYAGTFRTYNKGQIWRIGKGVE